MPKFVIERNVPGAERLSPDDLKNMSRTSNEALAKLGPTVRWLQSYVARDKIFCVYVAPDEKMVREHGRLGGFPVTNVYPVRTTIDPSTAEEPW